MLADTKPGIEERYETACSASSLKVNAERGGPADMLVASAWSHHGIGGALVRLHTSWLKVKPRPLTAQDVERYAATLPQRKGKADVGRARKELVDAYVLAVKETAEKVRGREEVVHHLTEWAALKGIDAGLVGPCLTFWLAPQCPVCHSRKQERMADAPVLVGKCGHCGGTGKRAAPLGGGRILDRIEHDINRWRSGTRSRLRGRD